MFFPKYLLGIQSNNVQQLHVTVSYNKETKRKEKEKEETNKQKTLQYYNTCLQLSKV
jgi:hypothetical protein